MNTQTLDELVQMAREAAKARDIGTLAEVSAEVKRREVQEAFRDAYLAAVRKEEGES
jgi:hypothetical protein